MTVLSVPCHPLHLDECLFLLGLALIHSCPTNSLVQLPDKHDHSSQKFWLAFSYMIAVVEPHNCFWLCSLLETIVTAANTVSTGFFLVLGHRISCSFQFLKTLVLVSTVVFFCLYLWIFHFISTLIFFKLESFLHLNLLTQNQTMECFL